MTSRRGIIPTFYGIEWRRRNGPVCPRCPVVPRGSVRSAVSDVSCVRLPPDPLHHALEIVVGDRLAVLAHGDDRVVHEDELVLRERDVQHLDASLYCVPAGMTAEDQLVGALSDVL